MDLAGRAFFGVWAVVLAGAGLRMASQYFAERGATESKPSDDEARRR